MLRRLREFEASLLSGHRAARWWLRSAFGVVAAAFLLLLSGSPKPGWAPWPTLSPNVPVEVAAAWVGFFGVLAAVIAIVAAYVELRTLFPAQELQVGVLRKPVEDWDLEICRLVFLNDTGGALISAYRIEVWVEDHRGFVQGHSSLDPSGPSGGDTGWDRVQSDEMRFFPFHWVLLRNEPFFPGTKIEAPFVDMREMSSDPLRWRAIWHTDRSSSEGTLTFDVPAAPTE